MSVGFRIDILLQKLVVEQMIVLGFVQVVFVVHGWAPKVKTGLYRPINSRGQLLTA
jgi:hypothetical protein